MNETNRSANGGSYVPGNVFQASAASGTKVLKRQWIHAVPELAP